MEVLEIDRVMVATPDAAAAAERFEELLGLRFGDVVDSETDLGGDIQRNQVTYAHPGLELVAPADDDSGVAAFLEANGPGLFGLVVRVADIEAAGAELAEQGVEPIGDETPDGVRELHYHPEDFGGIYTLLTEYHHPGFARAWE
jgi:methylmalonyl-CoA/ethylmalonyl-CoA epimerase